MQFLEYNTLSSVEEILIYIHRYFISNKNTKFKNVQELTNLADSWITYFRMITATLFAFQIMSGLSGSLLKRRKKEDLSVKLIIRCSKTQLFYLKSKNRTNTEIQWLKHKITLLMI